MILRAGRVLVDFNYQNRSESALRAGSWDAHASVATLQIETDDLSAGIALDFTGSDSAEAESADDAGDGDDKDEVSGDEDSEQGEPEESRGE